MHFVHDEIGELDVTVYNRVHLVIVVILAKGVDHRFRHLQRYLGCALVM